VSTGLDGAPASLANKVAAGAAGLVLLVAAGRRFANTVANFALADLIGETVR
jgi:hypothetical protein